MSFENQIKEILKARLEGTATEEELAAFSEAVRAIPYSTDPGYEALVNAKRAAFIVNLLGRAVGDECISQLTHILDHVHYDVLEYLGENGDSDA